MITIVKGNILETEADAIVNPVNCVGVMGKGLALQFKKKYPDMFQDYKSCCDLKNLKPGMLHIWKGDKLIINFPTKNHWKGKSEISYIELGLEQLAKEIEENGISSIAIPKLGCGLGGLDWLDVKPLIIRKLECLDVEIYLYE